jgi:sugar phosphate permease
VFIATLFAPILGGPASTVILTVMHGVAGVPGWQWMFILEGLPAILLGLVVLKYLTNHPSEATWLTLPERTWLAETLAGERASLERHQPYTLRGVFRDKRVWQLGCLFSCLNAGSYGMLLWMPQIVKSLGQLSDIEVGALSSLPFLLGVVGQITMSRHSDKVRERKNHLAACYFAASLALIASAVAPGAVSAYVCLCLVGATLYAGTPIFWTLVGSFMTGAAGAVGIALINTIAQVAGFFGPWFVGLIKDQTQSFGPALAMLAAFLLTAAILAVLLKNRPEGDETVAYDAMPLEAGQTT